MQTSYSRGTLTPKDPNTESLYLLALVVAVTLRVHVFEDTPQ